jgi:hypothetical protein
MPADEGLSEPWPFAATLSSGVGKVHIDVQIAVDASGEVVFSFDPIPLNEGSQFLMAGWYAEGDRPPALRLVGVARDQVTFLTEDLHLDKCSHRSDDSGEWLEIGGRCMAGTFRRPLQEVTPNPVLTLHIRGFEDFRGHQADCRLGVASIEPRRTTSDRNSISGSLRLHAKGTPDDLTAWREEAGRLLEHVRRVMSIAAASLLRSPITEFHAEGMLEVRAFSQIAQGPVGLRTIRSQRQEAIFNAAIESFFNPPIAAKQLFVAIEWFTMEATYNEMRLVCAMTALENLVEANLDNAERFIEEPIVFEKTRRVLRGVIRKCIAKWQTDGAAKVLMELNEKLSDLNRRSLMRKLEMLAGRWKVPLNEISEAKLRAALDARNRILHRGQYYEDMAATDEDLWVHITVIREVVLRILFTIVSYHGDYCSYIDHPQDKRFPPRSLSMDWLDVKAQ